MINDTFNASGNINENADANRIAECQSSEADMVETSFTKMIDELAMLQIKNNLIEAAYNEMFTHHILLKEQNKRLSDSLQFANINMNMAIDSKKNFLGVISHELITPLTAIMGFAELLSLSGLPQHQKIQVGHIMDASHQLHEMFTAILSYIQLKSEKMKVETKPFLATALLKAITDGIYNSALKKGLVVTTETDPRLPVLLGDEVLLKQALNSLAANAVKFTQQGSIHLAMQLLDKKEDHIHVALTVKDSGIGIPLESQHKLFQPFEPLDSSFKRSQEGIGLGLSICDELVKLLGGELEVESSLETGSLFRIKVWLASAGGN
jgi:signal transduction histidine kinase